MWGIISAIVGAVLGFGAGVIGINQVLPRNVNPNLANVSTTSACYNPQPDITITLNTADFQNVKDYRSTLNPAKFSGKPATFNTDMNTCSPEAMNSQTNREYILVRSNTRISSCKTDELAGPYNGENGKTCVAAAGAIDHRGTCDFQDYTELRKIADINDPQQGPLEIFWVPFSHNVCNPTELSNNEGPKNCGRSNLNLKEFVYVLKKRDAFDQSNPSKCVVKWDAGSTDKNACSHYFDVYMAKDVYDKYQNPVPTTDPDYGNFDYFKQAIENCQEHTTLNPVSDSVVGVFPPVFIKTPFFDNVNPPPAPVEGKVIPGNDDFILNNYRYYIISSTSNPIQTSLLQISKEVQTIDVCPAPTFKPLAQTAALPTAVPTFGPSCYSPLGTITLKNQDKKNIVFNVFTRYDSPETFYLKDESDTSGNVYQYTITQQTLPENDKYAPALQLTKLEFNTENEWTWATPWCKPAIYLYPQKPTEINVKLKLDGNMTVSNPEYDVNNGWNVSASPDGQLESRIMNQESWNKFPYLYYEANLNNVPIPKEGWVVEQSKLKMQISKIMSDIGFNEKETGDFLSYWLPRLNEKPYYFITLLPETTINTKEQLTFSQNPDTLIRTRFAFEGLDLPLFVTPINYTRHQRTGFTVTDWGGTLVGRGCQNISVK